MTEFLTVKVCQYILKCMDTPLRFSKHFNFDRTVFTSLVFEFLLQRRLLHSERPKLHIVLAVLSATGLIVLL